MQRASWTIPSTKLRRPRRAFETQRTPSPGARLPAAPALAAKAPMIPMTPPITAAALFLLSWSSGCQSRSVAALDAACQVVTIVFATAIAKLVSDEPNGPCYRGGQRYGRGDSPTLTGKTPVVSCWTAVTVTTLGATVWGTVVGMTVRLEED